MESMMESLHVTPPGQFGESGFLRVRKAGQNTASLRSVSSSHKAAVPFLQETERLQAGMHCNFFELEKFSIENGRICLNAEISLASECSDIRMWAQLFDARDESSPLAVYQMQEAKETTDMHYRIDDPVSGALERADDIEPEIVVHAEWMDESGVWDSAEIKESAVCDLADWDVIYPKTEENKYILWNHDGPQERPVPDKKKRTDGAILISLFRKPDNVKDLDYLCEYGKDRKGHPLLMVPGQGRITLRDENAEFEEGTASMYCCLRKAGQGGVYVAAAGRDDYSTGNAVITYHRKYITYTMYKEWGVSFLEPGSFTKHEFSYWIKLTYKRRGVEASRYLWLSDHVDYRKHYIQSVPHIVIMWGCIEEHSGIRMADGTQKEIRNIRIGDEALLADGNTGKVDNVWRGTEDSYYLLRTKSGKEIRAGGSHPFAAKEGVVAACRLKAGDTVLAWDADGRCMREDVLSDVKKVDGEITVCNLSLGGKQMIANGFVCGDMEMQNLRENTGDQYGGSYQ